MPCLHTCAAHPPSCPPHAHPQVLRKLIAYSLARPARESLFTVIGREEKYKAKMVCMACQ